MQWTFVFSLFFILSVVAKKNTDCGDGSYCPSGTTCCPIGEGSFGCCPIPDAVCCADHLHCCPSGMTCDTTHSMCTNGYRSQPFHKKMKAERNEVAESSEESKDQMPSNGGESCPDHKSRCPAKTTCCADKRGHPTGCCPAENAVCCEDGVHCCPHGSTCDLAHGTCLQEDEDESSESRPWFAQLASGRIVRKVGIAFTSTVRECSNGDMCSGDSTCCYNEEEEEATCCPFGRGQCCRGGKKCCPEGFSCSKFGDECLKEENSVSISMHMAATALARDAESKSAEEEDQKCPDNSRCPAGNTCCPIRSHLDGDITGYQCCSLSSGVCCSNHCCPRGFSCAEDGRCERLAFFKRSTE